MLPNAGAPAVQRLAHFSIMAAGSSRSRAVLAREPGAANRTKGESSMNTLFKLTSSLVLLTLLALGGAATPTEAGVPAPGPGRSFDAPFPLLDRKSTRPHSRHTDISPL